MAGGAEEGVGAERGSGGASGGHAGRGGERSGRIGTLSAPAPAPRAPAARRLERGAPGYPEGLEALADPPACVHVWGGDIPEARECAAVVGSRAATPYGLAIAGRL